MTFEKIVLYITVGTFLVIVILASRIIPFFTKIPRYYAWKTFAENSGLTLMYGTFFNEGRDPAPKIVGTYRQRSVMITADTRGKLGFSDSFTHIVISVKNRQTSDLPKGGVFYAKRSNLRDKFFKEYQNFFSESVSFSSYRIYSTSENLGNFINRHSSFQTIATDKRFSGLVIKEQNLYFRRRNVDVNSKNIHNLVDNLCDIAEAFEQYSMAWTK